MGAQLRLKLERPRAYRPEDFVPSDANADALEAIARWPKWHGGALALVGPAGSGKTHLARIWAERTGAVQLTGGDEGPVFDAAAAATPVLVEDADGEALCRCTTNPQQCGQIKTRLALMMRVGVVVRHGFKHANQ